MNPVQALQKRPYVALVLYILLGGARDVGTELWIKEWGGVPLSVLLLSYCLGAMVLGRITSRWEDKTTVPPAKARGWVVVTMGATILSFILTLWAIRSDLGAAYNSFIDYGAAPSFAVFFTILCVLWFKVEELKSPRLKWGYFFGFGLAISASVLFAWIESSGETGKMPVDGVLFGLGAALAWSPVPACNKVLLKRGYRATQVMTLRMLPLAFVSAVVMLANGEGHHLIAHPELLLFGLIFFALPVFLALLVLRHVDVFMLVAWQFCIPCWTYGLSLLAGIKTFHPAAAVTIAVVGAAVAIMQTNKKDS